MGANDMLVDEGMESFGNETVDAAPPPPPAPAKIAYIGAGDSVRVKLLAGVNAPTDGTPYPVVFSLDGNVSGPDGSALPLGEARLVAAAQGSLTDARALFRLTDLSVRLPNGRRKVYKVDGWVVGEDGVRGMQGILIDPIGKAIGGGMISGAFQGYGRAVRDSQIQIRNDNRGSTEIVNGDLGKFALGAAVSGGSNEWSSIIKDRLSQMVPQVQVLSGREATAIFSKSISVDGLFEALDEEETSPSSLD
jgi:conjugal transfer pilus assembly protein TraB